MFTGIVEATGKVVLLRPAAAGSRRLGITTTRNLSRLRLGDSIAVNGVCLTVVARRDRRFEADLGPETLACTTLGRLRPSDRIHVERPLRLGDRLGGHLVAGHVDGVGRIKARRTRGDTIELRIAAPAALAPYLALKGSVTVDGVSLTVNYVRQAAFGITLIPHTLSVTTLGERRVGDRVNIEADLIAKHVARLMGKALRAKH